MQGRGAECAEERDHMTEHGGTVSVSAIGRVCEKADTTVLTICLEGIRGTYAAAMDEVMRGTGEVRGCIIGAGLDGDVLRTGSVSVTQHFRREPLGDPRGGDGFRDVPDGFEYSCSMSARFPNDNGVLSDAVRRITDLGISPRIWFSYENSDREGMRRRALAIAARSAMEDAAAIAGATGSELGPLVSAEYRQESRTGSNGMALMCRAAPSDGFDITPEDDEVVVSASLEWAIAGSRRCPPPRDGSVRHIPYPRI